MYYKGTKTKCEDYNQLVTEGEQYTHPTNRYAYIKEHKNGIDFAILKHDNYESYMEQIENLDNWFNNTEI
jgi:hypothetical protein